MVQYVRWYHEPSDGPMHGERTLIKTGRSAGEPYVHTIHAVRRAHLGRYTCEIKNVVGINTCEAHLSVRSAAAAEMAAVAVVVAAQACWIASRRILG